ncbi:MAG TPA: helix-turn-helix domain-containing protein [Mucilaginibacter sp.]|jgi:hypothetical protein|nr:helix-turn-helix domain-containing protein [Mucilaginibacter sp.]
MKRGEILFKENWKEFEKGRKCLYAPADIIQDPELSAQAKVLFIIINSFSKKYGVCFASNKIFSEKLGLKETMLKKYLKELREYQIITTKIQPKHKWPRQIFIDFEGLSKRYPKLSNSLQDKRPKGWISFHPLEEDPNYEQLKGEYQCRQIGDKYIYYRSQSRK